MAVCSIVDKRISFPTKPQSTSRVRRITLWSAHRICSVMRRDCGQQILPDACHLVSKSLQVFARIYQKNLQRSKGGSTQCWGSAFFVTDHAVGRFSLENRRLKSLECTIVRVYKVVVWGWGVGVCLPLCVCVWAGGWMGGWVSVCLPVCLFACSCVSQLIQMCSVYIFISFSVSLPSDNDIGHLELTTQGPTEAATHSTHPSTATTRSTTASILQPQIPVFKCGRLPIVSYANGRLVCWRKNRHNLSYKTRSFWICGCHWYLHGDLPKPEKIYRILLLNEMVLFCVWVTNCSSSRWG